MPIHDNVRTVVGKVEQQTISIEALERFDFHAAARRAYAVVRTFDPVLTAASCAKGVI